MWTWFKSKKESKDPLFGFIQAQKKYGRKVRYPEGFIKKLEKEYGEGIVQILETTNNFLTEILDKRVKVLSLVLNRKEPAAWFNKRDPTIFVLNFGVNPSDPRAQVEIRKSAIENQMVEPKIINVKRGVLPEVVSFPNSQKYFEGAITLARTKKLDEAIEACRKAFEIDPKNKQYRYQLALLYHRRSDEERRLEDKLDDRIEALNLESGDLDIVYLEKTQEARRLKQNVIQF